jgi:hypothetical protein
MPPDKKLLMDERMEELLLLLFDDDDDDDDVATHAPFVAISVVSPWPAIVCYGGNEISPMLAVL